MPNYGLVVTPQYNPMSYEQYAKPFEEYGKAYNAMADAYDTLEMEANQWEKLAQNAKDKPEYDRYKKYADDLRLAADDLASNGLNQRTRGTLSNLRKRYAQEIKPIADAYAYREKMADEQRKLNPNGDIQFDTDFSNIGLGAIMANPNLSYRGRSLVDIEKEAFEQAKSFSSRSLETRKATELGSQYYQILQGVGQDAADAFLQGVRNGTNSNFTVKDLQALDDLYQEIRDARGTSATNSPYSEEQNALADDRILSGMMKGLTLADSYQTNHWALPGAGRGSGGGGNTPEIQEIGYEVTLPRTDTAGKKYVDRYTVVDEGGLPLYYDNAGKEIKDEVLLKKLVEQTPQVRYYLRPHNKNADIVDVMDAATGMVVTQDNGKAVTYNRKTEIWNSVTKRVEKIKKAQVPVSPYVIKIKTGGTGPNQKSAEPEYMSKSDAAKKISGEQLTANQLEAADWEKIPDSVKANKDGYVYYKVTEDRFGWGTGDNYYIYCVPTSAKTIEEQAAAQESFVGNEEE